VDIQVVVVLLVKAMMAVLTVMMVAAVVVAVHLRQDLAQAKVTVHMETLEEKVETVPHLQSLALL